MSLKDPDLKMSKSHRDPQSRILITDSPEEIHQKVASALTDSLNSVSFDPVERPGVSSLLQLLSHFEPQGRSAETLGNEMYAGRSLKELKLLVADAISQKLQPICQKYHDIISEDGGRYLDEVQRKGAVKARESAEATMVLVREAVGI